MQKPAKIGLKLVLEGIFLLVVGLGNLFSQKTTFGDLIPDRFLPSPIKPSDLLDCQRYFQLADSINTLVFGLTGINPIPEYHCGNDTSSYSRSSIDAYMKEVSPGSILARMIIDRNGLPLCCKVYMKGGDSPTKQIADALSKLIMMPSYRNGKPIPTECRFLYDFLAPRTYSRKSSDD
ncbi:MAG: hypothetical protein IH596_15515 [Bacteroidales bacterium]|nr:hypothetical protein [Bacteroidales bacterium]